MQQDLNLPLNEIDAKDMKTIKLPVIIILITFSLTNLNSTISYPEFQEIEVRFNPPKITSYKNTNYTTIEITGCRQHMKPGEPMIPYKTLKIKFTYKTEIESINVQATWQNIAGSYKIRPAPKPGIPDLVPPEESEPTPLIYNSPNPYPAKCYEYEIHNGIDLKTLKRATYLILRLYPVRYIPIEGRIEWTEKMRIDISYQTGNILQQEDPINLTVITSNTLLTYAQQYAQLKSKLGLSTRVVTTSWIYSNYNGVDNQEKIRNYIKDMVENYSTSFVTIYGDADQVPARYAYIPDGDPDDGDYVETDLYYADLDYTWNDNGDSKWGDLDNDQVDGFPDVLLGRIPIDTAQEANAYLNKLKNYNPNPAWFWRALLIGTDTFGGDEGIILKNYIEDNFIWDVYYVRKRYEGYNLSTAAVVSDINSGFGIVNFAGHGNYNVWSFGAGGYYTSSNAASQTNGYMMPIIFTMACLTGEWADADCIGEVFLFNSNGGGIGYFGASKLAWGYEDSGIYLGLAGEMDWRFNQALFLAMDSSQNVGAYLGAVWAEGIQNYISNHDIYTPYDSYGYLDWKTVAEYGTLLGDPALTFSPLSTYPYPFVTSNGNFSCVFVIGDTHSSWAGVPHGPWSGQAYSIDVTGATGVAGKLGEYVNRSVSGWVTMLDWDLLGGIASYNPDTGEVTILNTEDHLISVGGPKVNLVTYKFYKGLGIYWVNNETHDMMHSAGTGKDYVYDPSTMWMNADYAVIGIYLDNGRYVMLIYGITGYGTAAACAYLSAFDQFPSEQRNGTVILLYWEDANGNHWPDVGVDTFQILEEGLSVFHYFHLLQKS